MPYGKNLKVMPAVAHNYGMGKPFTKKELTKIILDKNEVIADLEKNAYGEGFWDDVRKGLVKHNERKKTTPISEEDWKKQMEDYEKPTENWGADELGGGAAPAAKPETPSAVAAAAAALQPVRTAIQNGIGDAIYGKSDDPKKQKKGLLGISEEGKEESKKKVMKNIVAPLAKTAMGLKKSMTDTWNLMFNKDQYNADMKAGLIKRIKKEEAEMGIVRDKTDPKLIVRKPRGLYKTETTDPEVESYKPIAHRDDSAKAKEFMIRVPNPLFGIVKPTSKTLAEAGIKLWAGVNSFKDDDIDYSLRALQNDKFMWIPEDRAKELYPKLRQFAADEQDKGLAEGFEDFGWSKGEMKQFAKIDPRTLTGIDLIEYKQAKLLQDKQVTKNALEKVTKDIAEEEKGKTIIRGERPVRIEPDQARLAKMREAKVRVEKRLVDLAERGKQDFKDMTMFAEADKAKRDQEYYAKQAADAVGREDVIDEEQADFAALPAEDRIAQLEEFIVQLREQGAPEWQIDEFDQQIRNVEEEVEEEEETRQAQGSVELLQQAEVAGGAKPCWKGYEMIGMKKKGKRTVPNCVPIGGEDGEMEGGGMVEFALAKAGRIIYNPDGNMTKAGRSTFTPDWDAYGEDAASGRKNAFNLSRSMYIQGKATELPGFKMVKDDTSLRFYRKDDENVILVGIRGTDVHSWTDLYTWAVIGRGVGEDLRFTTRYQEDLAKLVRFQRNYPPSQFYYVATGSSLAGSIADRFLELGIIEEAVTYNPSIEKKFILEENLLNHRIYLDTDPLFILMGQYAPNTEIRKNASRVDYYNPIKEKDQLVKSHSIYPLYNAAFEGGGMEGGGKTYTIEEWKAHFDAKLEQKRQQIEAREAKKKATAKAKRARAKVRRDERDKPKEPETPAPELETPVRTPFRTSQVIKATPPPKSKYQIEMEELEDELKRAIAEEAKSSKALSEFVDRGFPSDRTRARNLQEDSYEDGKRVKAARSRIFTMETDEKERLRKIAQREAEIKKYGLKRIDLSHRDLSGLEGVEDRVTRYVFNKKAYYIEDVGDEEDMNMDFYKSRQVLTADDGYRPPKLRRFGELGDAEYPFPGLMKAVIKKEFPSEKDFRETMGLPKISKAPASARVELREELVAEQPRSPGGEFALQSSEPGFAKIMKSPLFTEAQKRIMRNLRSRDIPAAQKAKLLARSGIARKLMEMMGTNTTAFQTKRGMLAIADKMDKRVAPVKVREAISLPPEMMKKMNAYESILATTIKNRTEIKTVRDVNVWGRDVATFLGYPFMLAEAGFGCLEVVHKAMEQDIFGFWGADGARVDALFGNQFIPKRKTGSNDTKRMMELQAEMTQKEDTEENVFGIMSGSVMCMNTAHISGRPPSKKLYIELTQLVMNELKGLGFVYSGYPHLKSAGMGYKRRSLYAVGFRPAVMAGEKKFTAEVKQKYQEMCRTELLPKLKERLDVLRAGFINEAKAVNKRLMGLLNPAEKRLVETAKNDGKYSERYMYIIHSPDRYK